MGAHALLSASSAARWLNCPRSVRLTEDLPDSGSTYAAEGTLAHAIAEDALGWYQAHSDLADWQVSDTLKANPLYYDGIVDDVMPYTEYVIGKLGDNAYLDIESRLDFSEYVPSGFGTGDAVVVKNGTLEIIDLKFGKGVLVDADHNPQIMLYGLGALIKYDFIFDIDRVRMTIVQPRLDHISVFEMSADDLRKWAEDTVRPTAKMAYAGDGLIKAGEWCRWCKLKQTCKERAAALMAVANKRKEAELSDEDIAAILAVRDEIKSWLSDIEDGVTDRLQHGGTLTGWKLVEGRSNRKVKDPDALAKALLTDYPDKPIYKPVELQTLTNLEKMIGKKKFAENYSDYLYKPPGKPTLVPESDKRPALGSVESEFEFEEAPKE